jgi:hypothetical protein
LDQFESAGANHGVRVLSQSQAWCVLWEKQALLNMDKARPVYVVADNLTWFDN